MFQHLLVPLDTLQDPTPLYQAATRIAGHVGAQVHLFTRSEPDGVEYVTSMDSIHSRLSSGAYGSETTILQEIEHCHADLLIMGSDCGPANTHPGKMALTEHVVLSTTIPVLLVRNSRGVRVPDATHPFRALIFSTAPPDPPISCRWSSR